ncbi:MAG TPA: alkaline phosphatase family protein [Solirubrobacteraceae bacterium]|nr:alkaline phosphatase family protein [Solirubrobacteraceae bacterium]
MRRLAGLVGIAAALAAACGSASSSAGPVQVGVSPVARLRGGPPAHVAVLVMENEEFGDVIGSSAAPFINSLAHRYALVRNLYGISHPSLPNYLALTGGSTFGITSDCTDCSVHATSLVDQLEQHGLSWKAYMEDLPQPCFTGAGSSGYAKKHDPFAYYTRITGDPARCRRIVPLSQLTSDARGGRLPRFVWITPNLCHDMHDCDVSVGDRFLSREVPPLLKALGPRGVLFLVWDEGSSDSSCCRLASGGHVVGVVAGGLASRGAQLGTPVDHYSVLQTVEDLLGVPRLRGAACACTPSLAPLLADSVRRPRRGR